MLLPLASVDVITVIMCKTVTQVEQVWGKALHKPQQQGSFNHSHGSPRGYYSFNTMFTAQLAENTL